jgi:hypothetical protein
MKAHHIPRDERLYRLVTSRTTRALKRLANLLDLLPEDETFIYRPPLLVTVDAKKQPFQNVD